MPTACRIAAQGERSKDPVSVTDFNFSAENFIFDASRKPNLTIVYDRNGQARQAIRVRLHAMQHAVGSRESWKEAT